MLSRRIHEVGGNGTGLASEKAFDLKRGFSASYSGKVGTMAITTLDDSIARLRRQLDELHFAIAIAARQRDIRRNVQLTLQSCRVREQLLNAQAQMFQGLPVLRFGQVSRAEGFSL
jgi:hypothetical protein